jgi:TorA maturation chaperone TorD
MNTFKIDVKDLQALSRLFSYPEKKPVNGDLRKLSLIAGKRWEVEPEGNGLLVLQNNYVNLFINALPEVPCPPYGSFYLEGTLMGPSTVHVKNLYHEYGFQTEEMPDHIAVELEFLAMLSTIAVHDPVQQDYDFLLNHLRQWTPEFFKRVEISDDKGFYKEVSRYARQVI